MPAQKSSQTGQSRRPAAPNNGQAPPDGAPAGPAFDAKTPQAKAPGGVQGLIARRVVKATKFDGPNPKFMKLVQNPVWNLLCDHYFRLEIGGWHRIPDEPSLIIGNHSGGSLTMDAWTLVHSWYRHFGTDRVLHGTAHDVLMAAPLLGDYFKVVGVIPASRKGVSTAFAMGHDVVVWPGGEQDAMRSWRKRDKAVLADRKGFVRQAIRSGVPIVPVATIGGHDTVFVLSEGRFLAKYTGLGKVLRGATMPIVAGPPFGIAIETIPMHLPLPAKIRTEFLEPIHVDKDPERVDDRAYVDEVYRDVEGAIQTGMNLLKKRRSFPIFG